MAEANKVRESTTHKIHLVNRESMEIGGVTDVISFDEQMVALSTLCGNIEINGSSLHIHVLSMEEGVVTLDGTIDSITYYETQDNHKVGGGFFSKLFH